MKRTPSLFWRTLLLILLLIVASLAAWLQSFRVFERTPRAESIAQQVVSIVNLTRAALLYADPAVRTNLLAELAANEGIRIYPLEPSDAVVPMPDRPLVRLVEQAIVARLGPATRVASSVDGVQGLWVSLSIDEDRYWVYIDRDPVSRTVGTQWIGWAAIALILSVIGAVLITRVINRPLAQLSQAAAALGRGQAPPLLPASGPAEIRTVNENFNRMVTDLAKLESDRAVLLAGISHDLRTPLTRLRLELEMAPIPEATRAAMLDDMVQMDAIVRQFLDYARSAPQQPREEIDVGALVDGALRRARFDSLPNTQLDLNLAPNLRVDGFRTELDRALDNLLTNALRYGRDARSGKLHVTVATAADAGNVVISVSDTGSGVREDEINRLLRPFERGDAARSGSTGAGLGLPIVERVARMHGGSLSLGSADDHGLRAELRLPRRGADSATAT